MRADGSDSSRAGLIAEARGLTELGKTEEAFRVYERALVVNPFDPELHYLAGTAAWRALLVEECGKHLHEAARLAPLHPAPHQSLADWCLNSGQPAEALIHSSRAMAIAPREPEVLATRACALAATGSSGEAWDIILGLCEGAYTPCRALALRGRLAPMFGDEKETLAVMLRLLDRADPTTPDRTCVQFAAARLLEASGQFDAAFAQVQSGHAFRSRPHNPRWMREFVDRAVNYYTPSKLHDLPRASHGSRRPVFIVGMPRSGTTLVEQILASHPQVHGAGELGLIPQLAEDACEFDSTRGREYPQCMDALSLLTCDHLAQKYLDQVAKIDNTHRYLTDKLPLNFMHLGLLTVLFPDCHIIHCIRDPMDTCLSCYTTDFAVGHEFAQELGQLGDFYVQYRRLMQHWQQTLNVPLLEMSYERLVFDPDNTIHDLLDGLQLPWDDKCIAFHRTRRPVGTASAQQVRRPIYHDSVGRWRHYEKHLGPLREALGDYAEDVGSARAYVGAA